MRLPGLDLLRAIAIVWVMLFHTWLIGGLGPDFKWLERYGWMGVDLFFALSGFLIGRQVLAPLAAGRRLDFGDFYLRRALRVLPAYWVMLALYLAWPALRELPAMEPWWTFAGFVYNLGADASRPAFSQVWSLCVEEHFYLLFPALAVWLVPRLSVRGFVLLCAALVVAGIGLRAGIWWADSRADAAGAAPRNWFIEDLYYPTWNRLDGLLAGVALAALWAFRRPWWDWGQRHANVVLGLGLLLLAAAMALFGQRTGLVANAFGWPVLALGMAMLVWAGASPGSVLGRWQVPGARWLALTSYSLYLSHKVAFGLVQRHAGQALQGHPWLAVAAYATAILTLGALLHYAVERPGLRLRVHWLRRRAANTAPA